MIIIKIRENNREDFKIIQRHDILKKKKKLGYDTTRTQQLIN